MNVVIVGAGELGRHVASILSKEKHNVALIDKNGKLLQELSSFLDVATRQGSGTDWQLLDELLEMKPDIFLALTGNDDTNLVACSIAKQLMYPRTVARVRDWRYLNRIRLDFGRLFDVDYFIGPELLAANDILKQILYSESIAVETFAHGALLLRTLMIPTGWQQGDASLKNLTLPPNLIVGLIRRSVPNKTEKEIIFPHGNDSILPGDEVTFIGDTEAIADIHTLFGIKTEKPQSVVIIGGSLTGLHLARLLSEKNIDVRIIDKSYDKCRLLADKLPDCTVMQHDATDIEFLRSEKLESTDVIAVCTNNDEINLMVSLLAKEIGAPEIILLLHNTAYMPIAANLNFRHVVSPRISAIDHILSQMMSGRVSSLVSLYENRAEIMEVNVSLNSKVVGIPLSELGPFLPKDLLIVMIQNRGRIMIAHGSRIISPGDTVIVVTTPKHVRELEKIF